MSNEYSVSAVCEDQYSRDIFLKIVLAGRSNVGKSNLINSFLSRKNLARTSSQPGKTRTLSFYKVNNSFYLVDVPGYGHAKVSKAQHEQFGEVTQDYLETGGNLEDLIVIIDARHEPVIDDIAMYNYALLLDLPILVVATKIDEIKKSQYNKVFSDLRKHLDLDHDNVSVLTYSSESKLHLAELNKWIRDKIRL